MFLFRKDETPADFDNDIEMEDEEETKEVIDNKYRLRKLLEHCSADEINTVLLPEAFESINFGDFLLHKVCSFICLHMFSQDMFFAGVSHLLTIRRLAKTTTVLAKSIFHMCTSRWKISTVPSLQKLPGITSL